MRSCQSRREVLASTTPSLPAASSMSVVDVASAEKTESRSEFMMLAGVGAGILFMCLIFVPLTLWLHSEKRAAESNFSGLNARNTELQSKDFDLRRANEELRRQLSGINDVVTKQGRELVIAKPAAQHFKELAELHSETIKVLNGDMSDLKKKHSETINVLNGEMSDLKGKHLETIDGINGKITGLRDELGREIQRLERELRDDELPKAKPAAQHFKELAEDHSKTIEGLYGKITGLGDQLGREIQRLQQELQKTQQLPDAPGAESPPRQRQPLIPPRSSVTRGALPAT